MNIIHVFYNTLNAGHSKDQKPEWIKIPIHAFFVRLHRLYTSPNAYWTAHQSKITHNPFTDQSIQYGIELKLTGLPLGMYKIHASLPKALHRDLYLIDTCTQISYPISKAPMRIQLNARNQQYPFLLYLADSSELLSAS
jgi:hypothetical protein